MSIRLVIAALMLAAPLAAAAPAADPALAELQDRDRQLFATGWRLASANAAFCGDAAPALGFSVLDAGGFGNSDQVRTQLGLSGDFAIGAVAPASPAAEAGLAANDTIIALNGIALAARYPRAKPAWQRLIDVTAAVDAAAAAGPVALTFASAGESPRTVTLTGIPACPSRFEVLDKGSRAAAEGTRVIFGRGFPGFAYPEAEFAAAVAHELAHNLLNHRMTLEAEGRSIGNVRLTEREADRLMPWLLANAGYEPEAAVRFMARWGPRHGGGIFRKRTHEGWDERAEAIRAEVAKIRGLMVSEGKADWARHFTREALD